MSKPPLLVHLIFHPHSEDARELARSVHRALNDDPAVPGLRVPTVFCPTDGDLPPSEFEQLNEAEHSLVVVLADTYVVDVDSDQERKWSSFIGDLFELCQDSSHRFFPIQLHEAAWDFDDRLRGTNFLRACAESNPDVRNALIMRRLVVELCRQLANEPQDMIGVSKAPLKLFLSHTKLDIDAEPKVTKALIEYLNHEQPVRAWVDSGDIDTGSPFADEIEQGVQDSSLLCVLTDHYSTREWCRKEIILAKQHERPVAVVAAFNQQEVRSFPYLGNVPVLRWPCIPVGTGDQEKTATSRKAAMAAVDLLLKETLRHRHATVLLNQTARSGDTVFARPPELLSLLQSKDAEMVLYPDPPLGSEELGLLNETDIPTTTPLWRLATDRTLKGTRLALSMSESTDIQRFGFDEFHFRDAMVEISRYLLIKGATLVYGGHLGDEGYTQVLFELVRMHHGQEGVEAVDRVVNTIGWPMPYSQELVAKYHRVARLERIDRPADLDACPGGAIADSVEANPFPGEQTAEYRYCWARGMTHMRETQIASNSGIAARIILGGKFGPPEKGPGSDENWYLGRIPGVLEEVVLSAQGGQPVFLVGAFGGAAALAIDLLEGADRSEATWYYQRRAPHSEAMRALYDRCGQNWMDYPEMVELFRQTGVDGINPLLSPDENRELFRTRNASRLIELILLGLSRLDAG